MYELKTKAILNFAQSFPDKAEGEASRHDCFAIAELMEEAGNTHHKSNGPGKLLAPCPVQ